MRVLVTGGAGYLGSVLTSQLLSNGHHVRVVDVFERGGEGLLYAVGHQHLETLAIDIRDTDELRPHLAGVDAIVHLAAIVGDPACERRARMAQEVNVEASRRLVVEAIKTGVGRFIFASTCSNYGRQRDLPGYVTESTALQPLSVYAKTKVAVEELLTGERIPMDIAVLRLATLFGLSPNMRFDLTVNEFVREVYCQGRLEIFSPDSWRPYLHVRDAANAIHLQLTSPDSGGTVEIYNVGTTVNNVRKRDIAALVMDHVGRSAEIVISDGGDDGRDYRVSFDKFASSFGDPGWLSLSNGIAEMVMALRNGMIADPYRRGYSVP